MSTLCRRLGVVSLLVAISGALSMTGAVASWGKSAPPGAQVHTRRALVLRAARPAVSIAGTRAVGTRDGSKARIADDATPVIHVDGNTLSWDPVPGVDRYVFVEKVPGKSDRYQDIQRTTIHPAAVPGKMVWFSVRANTPGSSWAPEVGISYPRSVGPSTPGMFNPGRLPFSVGLVAGSALETQLSYIRTLGARTARLEFDIDTPTSVVARVCAEYAQAGVRPLILASFYGRLPTAAEARRLGAWAAAVGPGGNAWDAKHQAGDSAVTYIEFGNETNYAYQFQDNSPSVYATRARTYAERFKDAEIAIKQANPHVGLLAIGDPVQQGEAWDRNLFKAVPDLASRVAGWTVHPYGAQWVQRIRSTIAATVRAGAPSQIPLWITEWGLASDGGSCLSDNYGFNPCMTYGSAASTLQSTLRGIRARFGSRIAAFYLFQASDQKAPDQTNNRESYFGALQSDGTAKGAYTDAVKADLGAP